ncbi:glycosyltransferase family 4 protein [Flavobacterium sp.]|uniref:glycosyltransferase family 4 protein n=1 Tax=Flavobacterium sp. TaxID=239 RepID=UPI003BEB54D9
MKNRKILYIGNKLSKHGYSITMMETLGDLLSNTGYTVSYASSKKNIVLRFLDMIFTLTYYSRTIDYVIIDTYSTLNFWYAFFVSQLCRLFKLKYITILHGGNLTNRIIKNPKYCDLIFNNAHRNVAPSGYLFNAFKENYFKGLVSIPNTIEIEKYDFYLREMQVPKLLWVRSFSPIYNPKMAIQVLAQLQKEYPTAELTMVGPDVNDYRKECELLAGKLTVKVNFTGKLSKAEWISLSNKHNVFINTSNFDNMPVSIIEAMALGLPVISTNVGGIPFLISDQKEGILVEENNCIEMNLAIKNLFLNQDLTTILITNARKKVELYDWQIIKLQWLEMLM